MTARIRRTVCALFALGLSAAQAQEPAWQQGWLDHLNRIRAREGAPPLRLIPVLAQVAQQQADEMVRRRLRSPSAQAVTERLRQVGYTAHDWGEAFVVSQGDRQSLRAALDARFHDVGIGQAVVEGSPFYVFVLGWHKGTFFARATAGLRDPERVAAGMLEQVNALRRRQGLPPLIASPLLDRMAQAHAEDMLARSYFGHSSPEGLGPSERARAHGYPWGAGENLVEERYSVQEAMDAWQRSPEHLRNILDPGCRELGVGLAVGAGYDAAPGGYRVIWVQSFGRGRRAGDPAP